VAPAPILVHLDESCLGNGRTGDNPGGAGGVIETRTASGIQRRDIFLSSPATTNNRMALAGAIATLEALSAKGRRLRVVIVSDSEYLVKGIRDWAPKWEALGWRRKGGAIENLGLWQELVRRSRDHEVQWRWVRGHKGHAKNEYANDLAIKAAKEQIDSGGVTESGFLDWLAAKRKKGLYVGYDEDEELRAKS
jgi:ribonuclease HI